jgi:hypothetical protein
MRLFGMALFGQVSSALTRLRVSLAVLSCSLFSFGATPSPAQPFAMGAQLSLYAVNRTQTPINIDGRLDELAWEQAVQINSFNRILNHYSPVAFPTRARMLWDDEFFYFSFSCIDDDIWALYDQEDDPMWSEEVVEVFIDPDGDGRNYLEVEVNPLNAVVDLRIESIEPEWRSSKDWDIAGLKTAVRLHGTVNDASDKDRGWSVEIAIPWSAMTDPDKGEIDGGGRPQAGDTWRLNLYRIERQAGREARATLVDLADQSEKLQHRLDDYRRAGSLRDSLALVTDAKNRRRLQAELDGLPQTPTAPEALQRELELLREQARPLQEDYNDHTEYTAWSETFQRGFHHPARFGLVQFVE